MKRLLWISIIITIALTCFSISYAGSFKDIIDTKYEGVVECLSFLKIVDGVGNNIFDANKVVTRAEISKMLVLAHGYEKTADLLDAPKAFSDVKEGSWYYEYVNIASAYGLLKGYPDGKFYPDRDVTYAEAIAMILRSLGHQYITEDNDAGWYFNYIQRMRDLRLNEGMTEFHYERGAKRGDIAILIWNMLKQHTWEIVKEEGKQNFTYVDSKKVLLNEAFGDEFELVDGKRLKRYYAQGGIAYGTLDVYGDVELKDLLPVYAIGSDVTGVLHKKSKVFSCAIFDIDLGIVDGPVKDVEADGYRIKKAKKVYYIGGKDTDYIFFAVNRTDGDITIDRAIALDLEEAIHVEKTKKEKDIITLNDEIEINTKEAILIDKKDAKDWSKVEKGDVILQVDTNLYWIVNKYVVKEEESNHKTKNKTDSLYYISSFGAWQKQTYIYLTSAERRGQYVCNADIKKFDVGDLVIADTSTGVITKIEKATAKDYENLNTGRKLLLDYSEQGYKKGMIGGYKIDDDTQIYVANKKYHSNTNDVIKKCTLEKADESYLRALDGETIHVIVEDDVAKIIYIEIKSNVFEIFYAKVKEVIQFRDQLKLLLSPTDLIVKEYATVGKVECEPGDLISYTLVEQEKDKEKAVKIKEIYHSNIIGYKGDLTVDYVEGDEIFLTNGESFNKKSLVIEADGKSYKLYEYVTIIAKVRRNGDGWAFSSTDFKDIRDIKFNPGDRIAIDEIEDVIVVYSGYEEE